MLAPDPACLSSWHMIQQHRDAEELVLFLSAAESQLFVVRTLMQTGQQVRLDIKMGSFSTDAY